MRLARLALAAFALAVPAACGDPSEKSCGGLRARVAACSPSLPQESADNVYAHCVLAMREPAPKDPRNLAGMMRRAFETCISATAGSACDCLAQQGCVFILTGPEDRVPELWCTSPPGR